MWKKICILFVLIAAAACAKIDPSALEVTPTDRETVDVLKECRYLYDGKRFTVAVVEFENNTTHTDAEVSTVRGRSRAAAGIGIGRGGIGIGAESHSSYEAVHKSLRPQLGEFAQGSVENIIVAIGGMQVHSRSRLDKILKEQKFQMTLADPDTVVNFGKLSGVDYIITGSVDNINASYTNPVDTSGVRTDNAWVNLAVLAAGVAYNSLAAGWNVETELTVQVIDTATGQIYKSGKAKGYKNIGDSPTFTTDQVIAGAKAAMGDSIKKIVPMLGDQFQAQGYINEMRGGKQAALISLGKENVGEDDVLTPYEISTTTDFKTGKSSCTLTPMSGYSLKVLPGVSESSAWTQVDAPSGAPRLKIGTIVARSKIAKRE